MFALNHFKRSEVTTILSLQQAQLQSRLVYFIRIND